jgi:hypothetical protein
LGMTMTELRRKLELELADDGVEEAEPVFADAWVELQLEADVVVVVDA